MVHNNNNKNNIAIVSDINGKYIQSDDVDITNSREQQDQQGTDSYDGEYLVTTFCKAILIYSLLFMIVQF